MQWSHFGGCSLFMVRSTNRLHPQEKGGHAWKVWVAFLSPGNVWLEILHGRVPSLCSIILLTLCHTISRAGPRSVCYYLLPTITLTRAGHHEEIQRKHGASFGTFLPLATLSLFPYLCALDDFITLGKNIKMWVLFQFREAEWCRFLLGS